MYDEVAMGLILCKSCVDSHIFGEFMGVMAVSCPEDSFLVPISLPSSSDLLSTIPSMMFPKLWRGNRAA